MAPVARPWPTAFAAFGLLVCTNGPSIYSALYWFDGGVSWQFWTFAYPFGAVAVIGTLLLWRELKGPALDRIPWQLYAVGAYVGWTLLSAWWSVSPYSTPNLAITGIGIAAFGCWFGLALGVHEHIWAIVTSTAVTSVASAAAIAWQPERGKMPLLVDDLGGEWRGIFNNRNSLAPVCVLGLIALVGFVGLRPRVSRVVVAVPLAILHIQLIRGAESETAVVALALVLLAGAVVPALWLLRRWVNGWIVAGGTLGGLAAGWVVVFANFDRLAEAVGRDPTLSRRRIIWADVREFIQVHPVRGYGYWAFWDRPDLTAETYARVGAAYGSAHNSVLEVLLGLGAIGLVIYLAVVAASVGGICRWVWTQASIASWWWFVLLVFLVAENLTESFVLWHSYNWVLFLAAAFVPLGPTARVARPAPDHEGDTHDV